MLPSRDSTEVKSSEATFSQGVSSFDLFSPLIFDKMI